MTFQQPLFWIGLITIPIILIMYLFRQKLIPKEIPSLMLWREALQTKQSQQPWQKLRRNLLMLLQILGAFLFVSALTGPAYYATQEIQDRVFVLDQSMSMQAIDIAPSRFEKAKSLIKSEIQSMQQGEKAALVILGVESYTAVPMTEDKQTLLSRLENIQPTFNGIDTKRCEKIVEEIIAEHDATVYLYSDQEIPLANEQTTTIMGNENQNTGITLLSYSRDNTNGLTVMVKVKNYGTKPDHNGVALYVNNQVFDVKEIVLMPEEENEIYFPLGDQQATLLSAKLSHEDYLPADDARYAVVQGLSAQRTILFTENNLFLEKALAIMPHVELYRGDIENMDNLSGYFLYIFDGILPEQLPKDGHLLILNPPEGNQYIQTQGEVEVKNVEATGHPFMRFIAQVEFGLAKTKVVTPPAWADIVLEDGETPLLFGGIDQNQKVVVFAFDLHQSDLPLKKEFPIVVYNLIDYFVPPSVVTESKTAPGKVLELTLSPEAEAAFVRSPGGNTIQLAPPFPPSLYSDTAEPGIYTLMQTVNQNEQEDYFVINLTDKSESDITPDLHTSVANENRVRTIMIGQSLTDILLLSLLVLLILEWWVFSREH